jgi:hypothetical protein
MNDVSQLSSMRLRGGADVTEKVCICHLCAFMCVCMCVFVYVRVHMCVRAPVRWCRRDWRSVHMRSMCLHAHVYIYVCVWVNVHDACVRLFVSV